MKTIPRAILDGILWVDSIVQRVVNAGMFALMRAGASKASIRYVLWAAGILAFAGITVCNIFAREVASTAICVAGTAGLLFVQRAERRMDQRQEEAGEVNGSGQSPGRWIWWSFLCIDVLRTAGVLGPSKAFVGRADLWCNFVRLSVAADVAFALVSYSHRTPPRPPARRRRIVLAHEASN
jgi:hypothetical protein